MAVQIKSDKWDFLFVKKENQIVGPTTNMAKL